MLVERYNHLGGLSTGGLVSWIDRMTDWEWEPPGGRRGRGAHLPLRTRRNPRTGPRDLGFEISYRSLIPASTNGLLAAGRNLSADTKSHAALREIPGCWVMGEAAGVAATLVVDGGVDVRDVGIRALQAQLVKQGGIVNRPTQRSQHDGSQVPDLGLEESIHWQAVDEARAFE